MTQSKQTEKQTWCPWNDEKIHVLIWHKREHGEAEAQATMSVLTRVRNEMQGCIEAQETEIARLRKIIKVLSNPIFTDFQEVFDGLAGSVERMHSVLQWARQAYSMTDDDNLRSTAPADIRKGTTT